MELTWIGYVNWVHSTVHKIFMEIGNGSCSTDAIYEMLKVVLNEAIEKTHARNEVGVKLSIIVEGDGCYIKSNGISPYLTRDTLHRVIADLHTIDTYLHNLSTPEKRSEKIPLEVVNALSSYFCVSTNKNGLCSILKYQNGIEDFVLTDSFDDYGIEFRFFPDKKILGDFSFNIGQVFSIATQYVKDNHNLLISVQDGSYATPIVFKTDE